MSIFRRPRDDFYADPAPEYYTTGEDRARWAEEYRKARATAAAQFREILASYPAARDTMECPKCLSVNLKRRFARGVSVVAFETVRTVADKRVGGYRDELSADLLDVTCECGHHLGYERPADSLTGEAA
jgi:hypothetical protein